MRKWNDQTYKYTSSQSFPKFLIITPAVCLLSLVHCAFLIDRYPCCVPAVARDLPFFLNFLSVVTPAVCLLSLVICPVRMEKIRKFLIVASVSWRYRHEVCVLRDGRTCFPRSIVVVQQWWWWRQKWLLLWHTVHRRLCAHATSATAHTAKRQNSGLTTILCSKHLTRFKLN